jgi:hypothetical protein
LADKLERSGKLKVGEEISVGTGKVKVTGITPGRTVTLETPDGAKTLIAQGDPNLLPEDTDSRKKLIVTGKDYAVVLSPKLSDFPKGEAQLFVYSGLHTYRNGEAPDGAPDFRVWPAVFPNGAIGGVLMTNDKPIELDPKKTSFDGPDGAFKLVTTWTDSGELRSFRLERGERKSAEISTKGRSSIDLVSGTGPTINRIATLARVSSGTGDAEKADGGVAPAAAETPAVEVSFKENPVAYVKPHLAWMLGGAAGGFLLAMVLGMFRRRTRSSYY